MATKYLSYFPKTLLEDFVNNRVVPFVGAGFSKNANIPEGLNMPNWNEVGKEVASNLPNYKYENNAIDALSYYELLFSRSKLIELLMRMMNVGKVKPSDTLKAFCSVFSGTICTTNFDFLLEEAMQELHRSVSTIVTEDRLTINPNNETRILKVHGDFNHPDKMVITEDDYDTYLEKNPVFATYVSNLFITNTMLLIGYSLDDNDFRGIWQIINSRLGTMSQPAYCILVKADDITVARYQRRHVRVINLPGEPKNYKTILKDLFTELREYITDEKGKVAKSAEDRINEQLLIPAEDNRLCFISCSMNRISKLTSILDPILLSSGVTPIRIDDMIMPGENVLEIVQTLINKCKLAIVDVSDYTPNTFYELGLLNKDKRDYTLLIQDNTQSGNMPSFITGVPILCYDPDNIDNNIFTDQVIKWLKNTISNTGVFADAERLLNKEEYSACIISIFSELEYIISLDTMYNKIYSSSKISTLPRWLRENSASKNANELIQYWQKRNAIVHGVAKSDKQEATKVLELAKSLYSEIHDRLSM